MAFKEYDQGLYFPIKLSDGSPVYADLDTSVEASVRTIMSWSIHRRIYDSPFGSITSYLYWPSVPANHQFLSASIRKSLIVNDNRIEDAVVNITTNDIGDKVNIEALIKIKNAETILVKSEL